MRAQEFVTETADAKSVLDYIHQTHHEPLTPKLQKAVLAHPSWRLTQVPLSSLHIPDQEYDDEEQEPESDPYNRVQAIDPEHAGEYSANFVDRRPIVVDSQGWIIDGNHRAWAAAELLNRDNIQAWVPVIKPGVAEAFDKPYKGKWEHGDESHDMLVRLPDGSNLSIMFSMDYGAYGDEEWTVEFWRGNSQDVTGEGDQQRIFATVLNAIQKFINKYHPERLRFSANKDVEPGQKSMSRTNLYNKLVKRYANSWGYDVDVDDFADTTVYNLYTMNESVAENFGVQVYPGVIPFGEYLGPDPEFASPGNYRDSAELHDEVYDLIDSGVEPEVVTMNPKQFLATQDWLSNAGGDDPLFDEYTDRPVIYQKAGKYYILDGHHRSTRALESGRPIAVYLFGDYQLDQLKENFADGKVKGKSRPGRVKRAGASCDGSVTSLRAKAKKYGGERGKMYHWCANMKGGRKK